MKASDWQVLRATPLFGAMSADTTLELVGGRSSERSFKRGTVIFQQGTPAKSFFVILEGWIKIFRVTPDGKEAVVGVFRMGETFAEAAIFLGDVYPVSAEAVTDCRLLVIDGQNFKRHILERPELALAMLASASRHLKFLVEQIEQMKVLDAPQRIADFFLRLGGATSGSCTVDLPYEKSLIAKRLGMKPESLSRAMLRLKPLGTVMERDRVTIGDVGLLRQFIEARPEDDDL